MKYLLIVGLAVAECCMANDVISACAVLKNADAYNGRVIAIRGELEFTMEGTYLWANDCKIKFVKRGQEWPLSINLIESRGNPDLPFNEESFRSTKRKVEDTLGNVWSRHPITKRAIVTFVGRFETLKDPLVADGRFWPNGYGHLNASAAQLEFQSCRDVVFEDIVETEKAVPKKKR